MTSTAPQITGNLVALDEQQRNDAIVAAAHGTVVLVGDTASLAAALGAKAGVTVVDEADDDSVLIARSERAAVLPADLVELVAGRAAAGGAWIVDTVAGDPARSVLERQAGGSASVLAECEIVGTLLAAEEDELAPKLTLATTVPVAVAGHASRLLLFSGLERPVPAAGQAMVFPSAADEISRLERQVAELERQNRRLAEGRLGVHDAAAARAAAAANELAAARAEVIGLHERLESAVFHAKQNDDLFQDARVQLFAAQARVATLEGELYRHQFDARRVTKRALAKFRNKIRPR